MFSLDITTYGATPTFVAKRVKERAWYVVFLFPLRAGLGLLLNPLFNPNASNSIGYTLYTGVIMNH